MSNSMTNLAIHVAASATLLASLVLPAPIVSAQPTPRSNNQCFYTRNINGFRAPDDHTLYIRVGVSDIYRLTLMTDCTGLTFKQGVGLESTPGDPWICSAIQATVVFRDTGIRNRCPVSDIHKLTPGEIAAMPKRDRP